MTACCVGTYYSDANGINSLAFILGSRFHLSSLDFIHNLIHKFLVACYQARIPEWVSIPFSSPGDFPDPGIEPGSPILQADSLPSEPPRKLTGNKSPSLFPQVPLVEFLASFKWNQSGICMFCSQEFSCITAALPRGCKVPGSLPAFLLLS